MLTCNKPIKCWDLLVRPCMRPAGHTPGKCNPFGVDHPFDPVKREQHQSKPAKDQLRTTAA